MQNTRKIEKQETKNYKKDKGNAEMSVTDDRSMVFWENEKMEKKNLKKKNMHKKILMTMAALFAAETILGTGVWKNETKAAEFTSEAVLLEQSAQWTDQENFKAELHLRVSGLQNLRQKLQSDASIPQAELEALELAEEEAEEDVKEEAEEEAGEETEQTDSVELVLPIENIESAQTEILPQETDEETRYFLTAYLSEYFEPADLENALWDKMQTERILVQAQNEKMTEIVKVTSPVEILEDTGDAFEMTLPVMLREEYRFLAVEQTYPLCQDEPLQKDSQGKGSFFWKKNGEIQTVLAESASGQLQVQAADVGILAQLEADVQQIKAGNAVNYTLKLCNTGKIDLEDIAVSSMFSTEEGKAVWEAEEGLQVNGTQAVLKRLKAGETRKIRMTFQLSQDQYGEMEHTVTVKTKHPGKEEMIESQTSVKIQIEALQASFEVEKTADRTTAFAGDTITYQICIRNTGEKTLHSVISTERFLNANIQAQFTPKEGVILNSAKTQALIEQIAPGEAAALYATVTIPQYFSNQELVNEVTVISDETGEQTHRSQSTLMIGTLSPSATISPTPTVSYQSYAASSKTGNAYAASSKPKTGDQAETGLFVVMGIFAVMSGIHAFCYQKSRKKGENQD